MKRYLNLLMLLFLGYNTQAQYDGKKYNQFSIEIAYNVSVPYTATDFKAQDNGNFTSFNGYNFGLRYMFNENIGLKGEITFNNYTGENSLGTEFTRLDAQAVYNLGRLIRLPYATNDKIGLLLHSGFGLSRSTSLSKNATENIWNYIIGITPIFSLSDRFSLATDITYVANFKQQFNYNGELFSDEKDTYKYGYNLNYSIGLIFYIGQKGRAADWY